MTKSEGAPADVVELFRAHYLGLVRLAMRLVDDQETAEDLVQDVFAAVAKHGRVPEAPLRYLRTAVVNRSRSALRRRRVARAFLAGRREEGLAESPEDAGLRRDAHRDMRAAIARLPIRQREVVVLRYYEDLPVGEIATALGVSPGAVSSALNRALATLAGRAEVDDE